MFIKIQFHDILQKCLKCELLYETEIFQIELADPKLLTTFCAQCMYIPLVSRALKALKGILKNYLINIISAFGTNFTYLLSMECAKLMMEYFSTVDDGILPKKFGEW